MRFRSAFSVRLGDPGPAVLAVALAAAATGCVGQPSPPNETGSPPTGGPSAASTGTVGPTATSVAPSPPASAPTTAGPWRSAPDQDAVRSVQFLDVAWTGRRFVAAGTSAGAGGALVDSLDGLEWHIQPGSSPADLPSRLAAGPAGVVAVGWIDDPAGAGSASWSSKDGLAWSARADAFPTEPSGSDVVEVTDVVATDSGWLAIGREDPFCQLDCGLDPVRALAWRSIDGLHWQAVAGTPSLDGAGMTAVTRHGSGFVAVGLTGPRAAAWTSPDGATWTRAPESAALDAIPSADRSIWTTMAAVASGHGVVVAVGSDGPGGAHGPAGRAWWSADGRTWTSAVGDGFEASGEVSVMLEAVGATPDGFVAVGSSDGTCRPGIWESSDGRAWRCAGGKALAAFGPYAVAASDTETVVVGLSDVPEPPPDGLPGAVWVRGLP